MPQDPNDFTSGLVPKAQTTDDFSSGLVPKPASKKGKLSYDSNYDTSAPDWSINNSGNIKKFYKDTYGADLPVTSFGQDATHKRMGWDHSNALDVGLNPTTKEGQGLAQYLRDNNVPFQSFDRAIQGVATGPHFHIGPKSRHAGQRPTSQAPAQGGFESGLVPVAETQQPPTDLGQGSSYTPGGTGATRPRSVRAVQPTVTASPQDHVAAIAANAPRPVTLGGAPQAQAQPQPRPQARQQRPTYNNNIDWHFGLSQQEFDALTPQQKAIAAQVANKASAEDQQKKDSGQTVEKSADYQASNRQRLGLKPQSTSQQASQAPPQDAVSNFYDSVQKNFAPALQSTTPEQDARIQAATELDNYEAQPDNTGQRRLDKTQRAAAIKKRASEIIDSRQAAAVEGESNAGSKVASVVRGGLQQFGNAPMGVPLEALPGGHYVKDKLTSYGEGVAGAVGGTVKQLGNAADIINKYTPVSAAARALSPRVKQAQDEGYNRARNLGSQIQSGVQQSEEAHPATGTADELVQGLARGAGGTTIEVPKLILGGTLLGAANLPAQGALSRYEEGAAGMVKGAAGGLVYHYGGGVTGPALGTVGNALFWTLAPAGVAVAGGESAGKAIGEALPMGAFMLHGGEGKESTKENGLPVSVKEADGTVRSATKEDITGIAKGELDVVPPPDPRQMNLTQRRSLGIGNIDVKDPQLKPRGEKQRRVALAKATAVSDQLDAKAKSRAANQPEPVQTSLDLNQPTEVKPTAPLLHKRVATPVEKELVKSVVKEHKERRSAERLAETDKLTGLPDVRALDKALPTAEADPNTKIVSFDFNDFKNRNKMFGEKGGEDSGDAHLKKGFAAIDAAAKANGGRAFRHGGDEGTVIVTGKTPQEAEALATKIRDEAEAAYGQNPYEGVHPQTGKQVSGSTSFSGVISDKVSGENAKDVATRLQTRKGSVKADSAILRADDLFQAAVRSPKFGTPLQEATDAAQSHVGGFYTPEAKHLEERFAKPEVRQAAQDALKPAIEVLRKQFGETIPLYRAESEGTADRSIFSYTSDESIAKAHAKGTNREITKTDVPLDAIVWMQARAPEGFKVAGGEREFLVDRRLLPTAPEPPTKPTKSATVQQASALNKLGWAVGDVRKLTQSEAQTALDRKLDWATAEGQMTALFKKGKHKDGLSALQALLGGGKAETPTPTTPTVPLKPRSSNGKVPTVARHPKDATYAGLLKHGTPAGENLYELSDKQVTPALRKKLNKPDPRGLPESPEETGAFSLRRKSDVTGNPLDRGWILKDKRSVSQNGNGKVAATGDVPAGTITFKTAKGSTYTVNSDGTTTRNKSFHPEHGPKDVGPQPKSQATYYVSVEDANKLGEIQTEGHKRSLVKWTGTDGKSYIGIRYEEGKDKGKVEHRTAVTYSTEPSVGKLPVEVWKGGKGSKNVHFGNEIVSIDGGKSAVVEPAAPDGDWLTNLFEQPVKPGLAQAESSVANPLSGLARELRIHADESKASAADWAGRKYKGNTKGITFEGDGPTRHETISVSQANESRRQRNVELFTTQGEQAARVADAIESGKLTQEQLFKQIGDLEAQIKDARSNTVYGGKGPRPTLDSDLTQAIASSILKSNQTGENSVAGKILKVYRDSAPQSGSKGASFHHTDFGSVTESNNQTGIPKGSVRVTDEQGTEHVIKRPSARGKGNQRAVPVKETAPTEAPYKYQPLDVSKDVAGTTMYHGTKSPIEALSEADPAQFASTDALYGHGLYLTDNAEVAKGYAETKGRGASGKVLSAELGNVKLLDLEQPLPTEVQRVFDQVNVDGPGDRSAATGKEVFSKLKAEMADAGITKSDATEIYQNLTTALQDLGYDGFRHEGGALKGKEHGPHNVAILFPDYGVGKSAKELLKVPGESGASAVTAKTAEEPAPPVSEQIKGIADRMKQQAEREQSRTDAPYVLDSRTGKPSTEVEASGKSVRGSSHHILIETKDGTQRITAVGTKVPMKTVDAVRDSLNNSERSKVVANAMKRAMDESHPGQAGSARLFAPFESLFNKGYDLYLDGVEKYAYWKEAARLKKIAGKDVSDRVLSQTFKAIDSAVKEVRAEQPPKTPTKAVEPPQEAEKVTGVKNAIVEPEREARGLDPVQRQAYTAIGESYLTGRAKVLDGTIDAKELARKVSDKPRPLTATEVGALGFERARLINQHAEAVKDAAEAKTEIEKAEARARMFEAEGHLDKNDEALVKGGREQSAAFNARKMLIREDYSLAAITRKAKALRGEDLPEKDRTRLEDLSKGLTDAMAESNSHETEAAKKAGQKVIDGIQKQVDREFDNQARKQKRAQSKAQLDSEFESLKKELASVSKSTRNGVQPSMLAGLDPEGKITKVILKMAKNRVKAGFNEVGSLVDEIHNHVKDFIDDKSAIMEAVSGYGKQRGLDKDPDAVKLRDLKRQMRLILSIEDAEKGVNPAKSGIKMEADSPKAAALRAQLKELVGERGLRDPLPAVKSRLKKQITELEGKLQSGDFSKKEKKRVVYDAEADALKLKVDKLKHDIDVELGKQRRILPEDWIIAYQRGAILSGPISIPKLGMAAISRIVSNPLEEITGGVLSKIPVVSKVAKRAPREGGFNLTAEGKSAVAAMKSLPDMWEKIKSGKNSLDFKHGKKLEGPSRALLKWFELAGRIHGALKTPAQRSEYFRSLEKRTAFAERNKANLGDPSVIAAIQEQAYQDSMRAILMQDNMAVDVYKRMVQALDQRGANLARKGEKGSWTARGAALLTRLETPIVKIPTNFVKETFDYSTLGLPAMSRLARQIVMRGGIDKLSGDEADTIMRGLKKGGVGAAMSILGGTLLHSKLSGFYQPGQDKKFKKGQIGRFEYDTGAQIGSLKIPKFLMHAPFLEAMQVAATFRDVMDHSEGSRLDKTAAGAKAATIGLAKEVPMVEESYKPLKQIFDKNSSWGNFFGDKVRGFIPIPIQQGAEMQDVDENGERVKRKPEGFKDTVYTGIPWVRPRVQSQGQADFVSGMKRKIAARNRALLKH